jgi:hypothetical protein
MAVAARLPMSKRALPYWYFVPYDPDVQRALDELRLREFGAGRYYPVLPRMYFADPNLCLLNPGPRHRTVAHAIAAAGDDGTRSILDIDALAPALESGAAAPFAERTLREVFDSATPSHAAVEEHIAELLEDVRPGQCGYVVVYEDEAPTELFFVGYPAR